MAKRKKKRNLPRNTGHKARLRKAIRERDGDTCFYCGRELEFANHKSKAYATIEHLEAKANGGTFELDNLVLADQQCNLLMRDLPVEKKMELRESIHPGCGSTCNHVST